MALEEPESTPFTSGSIRRGQLEPWESEKFNDEAYTALEVLQSEVYETNGGEDFGLTAASEQSSRQWRCSKFRSSVLSGLSPRLWFTYTLGKLVPIRAISFSFYFPFAWVALSRA